MFYRRRLPHLQRDGKPHFITFVTLGRLILPGRARDIVLSCCVHDHNSRYILHAGVVMPDHVHLILTPLTNVTRGQEWTLPEILDAIKGASAHRVNKALSRHGPVWQQESFDHVLRTSESLDQKITYVLQNPARKGLVSFPKAYPWLWYQPAGTYATNWIAK